jgi:hypothetical protein
VIQNKTGKMNKKSKRLQKLKFPSWWLFDKGDSLFAGMVGRVALVQRHAGRG